MDLEVRDFRLMVQGDRAVAEAWLELTVKLPGGRKEQKEETVRNDVLWRLRRTPAGWKIYEEILN
jgi:ketosteroid isomerase-like protein